MLLRRGVLPFVRRRSSFFVVVRSAMFKSVGKKKVIKKQRRSKE
jgi:hypothetical protein